MGTERFIGIHKAGIALAIALLAVGTAAEEKTSRSVFYAGAGALYDFDSVIVVYPAGADEEVERNRRSAELRAGYLRVEHGVRAEARPDDGVSEDELAGNLLVLGWTNRLLGTEAAPRPFDRRSTGLDFLGRTEADPDADLLFYAPSPFNPESRLVFWSRIDPERDRFQPLPLVGSDWAIFDDFRAVQQGMFVPGESWPPERNVDNQSDSHNYLDSMRKLRTREKSTHYFVSYDRTALDEEEVQTIIKAREQALGGAATAVGQSSAGMIIQLFVYADAEQKERITGVSDPVHSIPSRRELHMALPHARSAFPHEEVHHIAGRAFGNGNLTSVYEGLALSADGLYEGMPIDVHAAMMLEAEAFPALDDLLDETAARSLSDPVRFPAAGMLMRWIWETADPGRRRAVYSLRDGSVANLAAALGVPAKSVEPAFRKWLAERSAERESDLRFAELEAQARERLLASDYEGVVTATRKMAEIRPSDPQTLFNLASAMMRTGAHDEAEQVLRDLLALELPPSDSRFVIFSHYQLGRLLDIQGRRDDALAEYRRVLDLPDQHDAHRLAREAIESPITPEHLQ